MFSVRTDHDEEKGLWPFNTALPWLTATPDLFEMLIMFIELRA